MASNRPADGLYYGEDYGEDFSGMFSGVTWSPKVTACMGSGAMSLRSFGLVRKGYGSIRDWEARYEIPLAGPLACEPREPLGCPV